MIAAKVTVEINIVLFDFGGELTVSLVCECGSFLGISTLLMVVLKVLNCSVKLALKHTNSFNWTLRDVTSKVGVELTDVIEVDVEAGSLLSDEVVNFLLVFSGAHVVADDVLHALFVESRSICLAHSVGIGVDLHFGCCCKVTA
jgi:hypothetical protein